MFMPPLGNIKVVWQSLEMKSHKLIAFGVFVMTNILNASVNIVSNGDFETGELAPWFSTSSIPSSGSISVISSETYSGNYSLFSDAKTNEIRIPFSPFYVKDIIRFGFNVKAITSGLETPYQYVILRGFLDNTYRAHGYGISLVPSVWQYFDITENLRQLSPDESIFDIKLITFSSGTDSNEVVSYYDNFSIDIIPEPSSLSLLAMGGVFVALGGRRK